MFSCCGQKENKEDDIITENNIITPSIIFPSPPGINNKTTILTHFPPPPGLNFSKNNDINNIINNEVQEDSCISNIENNIIIKVFQQLLTIRCS